MNIIRCLTLVLPLSSGIVSTPTLADLYATTSFETTYTAYDPSGSLAWQFRLQIYTPTAAGTYPIAIVVGGSGAPRTRPSAARATGPTPPSSRRTPPSAAWSPPLSITTVPTATSAAAPAARIGPAPRSTARRCSAPPPTTAGTTRRAPYSIMPTPTPPCGGSYRPGKQGSQGRPCARAGRVGSQPGVVAGTAGRRLYPGQ